MNTPKHTQKSRASDIFALISNVVPLCGAIFFGWDIATLVIIYWFESGIIGTYNILKIYANKTLILVTDRFDEAFAQPAVLEPSMGKTYYSAKQTARLKWFASCFFCAHYGLFMFVHALFISFFLEFFGTHSFDPWQISLPILAMIISHGYSWWDNYIQKGERNKITVVRLLFAPYKRIFVMQFAIILCAFVIVAVLPFFPYPFLFSAVLIMVKTYADWSAHRREHSVFARFEDTTEE